MPRFGRSLLVLTMVSASVAVAPPPSQAHRSAVPAPPARAAATLPPGFVLTSSGSGQAPGDLTDFAYLPEGTTLTTGKSGKVAWVPAEGPAVTIAQLPTITERDLGLVGIALAHDYTATRHVYTLRPLVKGDGSRVARLSRWTLVTNPNPSALSGEQVLLEVSSDSDVHGLTGIVAAPDGTLWVSLGDSADFLHADIRAFRALDVNDLHGKVLHLNPDGTGVSSNPFFVSGEPRAARSLVYASGFRSPFRLVLDPNSGLPIVGDVGMSDFEEVDVVRAGRSYGWPCWEGRQRTPAYRDQGACNGVSHTEPLWTYPGTVGGSVTGGTVYTGTSYPPAYQGAYFFGDFSTEKLWTLRYDNAGNLTRAPENPPFGQGVGGPVKFANGPNGDIVYADIYNSTLKRLSYRPGNRAPTARAVTGTDPVARNVIFDGRESSDLDGDPLTYRWEFGDGATATGLITGHRYDPAVTTTTARLTVTDPLGASDTISIPVAPGNFAPRLNLNGPAPGQTFAVGDPVTATATATDPEDGPLPIHWTTTLVHCREDVCHDHPGLIVDGGSYATTFDDHGDESRLEVTATATDYFGVQSRVTFEAQPRLRRLAFATTRPATIVLNGQPSNGQMVTAGSSNLITAAPLSSDGTFSFQRWSDDAPRQRLVTMPDADLTLTAVYRAGTPATDRFITAVHTDFLGRPPTGNDLAAWNSALASGLAPGQFAYFLAGGPEYVGAVVDRYYRETLGRPADGPGQAYWVGEIRSGRLTVAQVATHFYASPEYVARAGGTLRSWVADLYRRLLKREPDGPGLDFWTYRAAFYGTFVVGFEFYQSFESALSRTATRYQSLLGRPPEPGGHSYWAFRILGEGDLVLAANLAASPEYFQRAQARFP